MSLLLHVLCGLSVTLCVAQEISVAVCYGFAKGDQELSLWLKNAIKNKTPYLEIIAKPIEKLSYMQLQELIYEIEEREGLVQLIGAHYKDPAGTYSKYIYGLLDLSLDSTDEELQNYKKHGCAQQSTHHQLLGIVTECVVHLLRTDC